MMIIMMMKEQNLSDNFCVLTSFSERVTQFRVITAKLDEIIPNFGLLWSANEMTMTNFCCCHVCHLKSVLNGSFKSFKIMRLR